MTDHITPPEGAVILGKGGTFKVSIGEAFKGWIWIPAPKIWGSGNYFSGTCPETLYAAPADSEVVQINRKGHRLDCSVWDGNGRCDCPQDYDHCAVMDEVRKSLNQLSGNSEELPTAQLEKLWANGKEAWKDVPDASKWVDEQRGNIQSPTGQETGTPECETCGGSGAVSVHPEFSSSPCPACNMSEPKKKKACDDHYHLELKVEEWESCPDCGINLWEMPSERPTPRTDALLLEINEGRVYEKDGPVADFARTLERELTSEREEIARWKEMTANRSEEATEWCRRFRDQQNEASLWKKKFLMQRDEANGDTWIWMGDGEDHPESITCPVIVSPDQIRDFVRHQGTSRKMRSALGKAQQLIQPLTDRDYELPNLFHIDGYLAFQDLNDGIQSALALANGKGVAE